MQLPGRVKRMIRFEQYSTRSERGCSECIHRFILFHNRHHPETMRVTEPEPFLTHRAIKWKAVVAGTQGLLKAFS